MLCQDILQIIGEYFYSILILGISLILAKILNTTLKRLINRSEAKEDHKFMNNILKYLHPLYWIVIFVGFYLALRIIPFLAEYIMWVDSTFFVIIVILICYALGRVLEIFIMRWLKRKKAEEEIKIPGILIKGITAIIYLVGILVILGTYSVDITPLITTLGISGIAIGFALQNTLSNLFAGIHILTDRPINVGDYIEIEGSNIGGYVQDIRWASTRIRTFSDVVIIIPNSKLAQSVIKNHHTLKPKSFGVTNAVDYSCDLDKVEKIALDVAQHIQKTVPGGSKGKNPVVRFQNFGASTIEFGIYLYVENYEAQFLMKHEFIKALKKRFDAEGIDMPPPIRRVFIRQESAPETTPAGKLH